MQTMITTEALARLSAAAAETAKLNRKNEYGYVAVSHIIRAISEESEFIRQNDVASTGPLLAMRTLLSDSLRRIAQRAAEAIENEPN